MRVVLVVLSLIGGLSACSAGHPPATGPVPTSAGTPLASYDSTGFAVPRADVCGLIATESVQQALGAEVVSTASHGNGDKVEVAPGVTDVVHEFSCSWTVADGTTASVWVFAPPVTTAEARDLGREVARDRGCRAVQGPDFGTESVLTVCQRGKGKTVAAFHGLFGDAWLSCNVVGPGRPSTLREKAARWCVDVLAATRVTP